MRCSCNSGRLVYRQAPVAALGVKAGLARVQPHSNPQRYPWRPRLGSKGRLGVHTRLGRATGALEDDEEAVALSALLDSAMGDPRLA
jgi:hypothetical protein